MSISVRCETCGKQAQFSASDAGLTALCMACGARLTVPGDHRVIPVPPRGQASAPGDSLSFQGLADEPVRDPASALAAAVRGDAAPPGPDDAINPSAFAPPAPARARVNYPLILGVAGSVLVVVLALTIVAVVRSRAGWEDRNRAAIRDVIARAQTLKADQNLREAHETYGALDALVGDRTIRDKALRGDVERARADRDWLAKAMAARAREQYATVTVPRTTGSRAATLPATRTANAPTTTMTAASPGVAPGPPAPPPTADATPAPVPDVPFDPPAEHDWPNYIPRMLAKGATSQPPAPVTRPTTGTAAATTALAPAKAPETRPAAAQTRPTAVAASPPQDKPDAVATEPAIPRPAITVRVGAATTAAAAPPRDGITDELIGRAIQRGVDHLLRQFHDGQLANAGAHNDTYHTGLNALCVYALLQSSYAIKDERLNLKGPFVREMVNRMKGMRADRGPVTYARSIRATALALLNRPEDKAAIAADVGYLLSSHGAGAYTYAKRPDVSPGRVPAEDWGWDNSNSQYGLLGVWSAAEIGAEVNGTYWKAVENHWARSQRPNGSWDYRYYRGGNSGRLSMTVAGVASLFVTHDYLDAPRIGGQVGREPFSPALARGLAYLEQGDVAVNAGEGGYTLYGIERVGLASGFKFFGENDWYRVLAAAVVADQEADGSWGSEVETAFRLLFLARGRHPILMNKLRYEGNWANRPRDVANLARFGTKELERPLNWQVVPITREWTDWMDAPILYVATHKPVTFHPIELARLRSYVEAGGMLFTQADGGQAEADAWAEDLAKRLFPDYPMADLPEGHEIFGILYKPSERPRLRYVTNGSRILMLHSPTDITQNWQMRQDKGRRALFELGINIFLYASGKGDLRNRLTSPVIPVPPTPPGGGRLSVARLRYDGNWNPEPMAWTRFAHYFQRETDVGLDVLPTPLAQLNPRSTILAHWTGTAAVAPTAAEIAAIRKFVEAGGVLLVEPTGGSGEFYESAKLALRKAFPDAPPQLLPKNHPILNATGPGTDDLTTPKVRAYVRAKGFAAGGRLDTITFGRGKVILNPLDLTTGLLGCNTWGVLGFEPPYAMSLVKNVVLWSATGMPEAIKER